MSVRSARNNACTVVYRKQQKETEKLSLELQGKADQWRIDFGVK
ncbi:hypothetical protein T4A_2065 [Trichinella pseudospiralis]|uniref:Uncharacterized protein n=1 Tax=Trichinella pseudospiralis TaxID=6337 RepID=A0A0V1DM88_TRIPS|nr:hypothetical protein T4A_2065 [Trichinella pseudospiralis]